MLQPPHVLFPFCHYHVTMKIKGEKRGKWMITLIMAAFAPGLALLSFFYLKERFDHEPIGIVIRMFIFGAILVFPIMVIQYTFMETLQLSDTVQAFLNSALLEEFFKWFILYFLVYHHVEFNQRYDGIIYSVAVSLGFATMENVFYLWIHGVHEAMMRALLPVSSHALFGVIMGYYLGKGKFTVQESKQKVILLYSILIPISLHGTYNYILLIGNEWWVWMIVPFMIGLWWYGMKKVKKARNYPISYPHSPSKNRLEG
jgi:RsiW-degrading membrane proteinase PrsW (M82 family)